MSNTKRDFGHHALRRISHVVIGLTFVLVGMLIAIGIARWQETSSSTAWTLDVAIILGGMALVALALMYVGMGHDVVKIARAIQHLESGDLTASIDRLKTSEGSRIASNLHRAIDGIKYIVGSVGQSAAQVHRHAASLTVAADSLAERTEHQAATLEEISTGLEELAVSVRSNAEHCRQVSAITQEAKKAAHEGTDSMLEVQQSMSEIRTATARVNEMLGLIEGVAFQTNILALNASVEAARAGEQGRGFAVVATEVRALSQRCSAATTEIKTVLNQANAVVSQGGDAVKRTMGILTHSAQGISAMSGRIEEIAQSSREQAVSVDQVNQAIVTLDAHSQQNVSLVSDAVGMAKELNDQANALHDMVARFKLDRMAERDQAVSLVKRAIVHLRRSRDRSKVFEDFARPNGDYRVGDLYVYVVDTAGNMLLHPTLRDNVLDVADADGKFFFRPVVEIAGKRGKGWEDYKWLNPVSNRIEPKSTYFERVDDLILCCGIYVREEQSPRAASRRPQIRRGARSRTLALAA
jgi:methyl-accepting chemotaxis protein